MAVSRSLTAESPIERLAHTHGLVRPNDPECSPERRCLRCEVERYEAALLARTEAVEKALAAARRSHLGDAQIANAMVNHFPVEIRCDHEAKQDKVFCDCGVVDLGWHPSVRRAKEAWAAHVVAVVKEARLTVDAALAPSSPAAEAESVDLDRAEELLRRLQSLMPLADLKGLALSREYTRRGLVSGALRAIGRHIDQKEARAGGVSDSQQTVSVTGQPPERSMGAGIVDDFAHDFAHDLRKLADHDSAGPGSSVTGEDA